MTNTVATTRIASAATVAILAGANVSERCGVIVSRTDYTAPLGSNKEIGRVAFVIRLDGGIGSDFRTVDQTVDAVTAVLQEGDQVCVRISDDVHVETIAQPIFSWPSTNEPVEGKILREVNYRNNKGEQCKATLVLGRTGLCVVDTGASEPSHSYMFGGADYVERVGVVLKCTEYTSPRMDANVSRIGAQSPRRVSFMVRVDGGIGSDIVVVDQTLDAVSSLVRKDDQVSVRLFDNPHIESTVAPVFAWPVSEAPCSGEILRVSDFTDGNGVDCVASVVLTAAGLAIDVQNPALFRKN